MEILAIEIPLTRKILDGAMIADGGVQSSTEVVGCGSINKR